MPSPLFKAAHMSFPLVGYRVPKSFQWHVFLWPEGQCD